MRRLLVLAALLVVSSGCSLLAKSDKAFVADMSAERLYQVNRYKRFCLDVHGPADCKNMQTILNTLEANDVGAEGKTPIKVGLIPTAFQVEAIGMLPKQERKELEDFMAQLRRLP